MHKRVKTTYYGYAMKGIAEHAGPCSESMVQQCSPSLLLDLFQLGAQVRVHTCLRQGYRLEAFSGEEAL